MTDIPATIGKLSQQLDADVIFYSGEINIKGADKIIDITNKPDHKNVILALCTPGGCANSAFKIARRLQEKYDCFILYIYGYCKSAGTLIAIGADKIIMGDYAEFGPLDVQLQDKDEIARYSSGLNIDEALLSLKIETTQFFRNTLLQLASEEGISTKTAAELSTQLATGFYNPIVSQIEPMRIGEIRRAVKIAIAYGERLIANERGNLKSSKEIAKLVNSYPDHGFVIDFKEAQTIFKDIRTHNADELAVGKSFSAFLRYPTKGPIFVDMVSKEKDDGNANSSKPANSGRTGKDKIRKGKAHERPSGKLVPFKRAR